jgi:hypothetical protein
MGGKKKTQYVDITASKAARDNFGTIFDSMCTDKSFQRLSIAARLFYCYCRVQAKTTRCTACLYEHAKEFGKTYNQNCFVFPASHLALYGYDRSNASRYFKELENAGFIRKLEPNKHMKRVNVYEFCDTWKDTS